jgi:hypothetical protein
MNKQIKLFQREPVKADIVYTPRHISKGIIDFLKPKGNILDPCKGDGAFYDFLTNADYCEIQEGKDFFDYEKKVDWIIGNPPYSVFEDFLRYSFEISDNVSFLVPTNKVFQRQVIMEMINKYGGVRSQIIYGSGALIDFPFGFSVGNFHFQKGYKGKCEIIMGMNAIKKPSRIVV